MRVHFRANELLDFSPSINEGVWTENHASSLFFAGHWTTFFGTRTVKAIHPTRMHETLYILQAHLAHGFRCKISFYCKNHRKCFENPVFQRGGPRDVEEQTIESVGGAPDLHDCT